MQDAVDDDASLVKYWIRGSHRSLKLQPHLIAKEMAPFNKKAKCRSERQVDLILTFVESTDCLPTLEHRGRMQVTAQQPGQRQGDEHDGSDQQHRPRQFGEVTGMRVALSPS